MRSENTVTNTINRYRSFRYALILEGVAVGAISGVVVVAFRYLLGYAEILLNSVLNYGRTHTWFVPVWFVVLAVAAIIVAMLLKWDSLISGSGIPQVEYRAAVFPRWKARSWARSTNAGGGSCWLSWQAA